MLKRRLHRWIGFALAIPLLWLAMTGIALEAANTWRDSHAPHPPARAADPSDSQIRRWLRIFATLETQPFKSELRGLSFNGEASECARAYLQNGDTLFFDPATGAPVGRRQAEEFAWVKTLTQLHRGKFFGPAGRYLFSGFGLGGVLLILSGLALLRRLGKKRGLGERHMLLGTYLALPLGFILATGAFWNLSEELRALPPAPAASASADWRRAFEIAVASNSGELPRELFRVQGRFMAAYADATRIYIDATGAADLHRPFTLRGWFEPFLKFHSGEYPLGVAITLGSGLGAIAIVLTGIFLQARRLRHLKRHK